MINNKKRILSVFTSIILVSNLLAQIGINTEQPLADLDVNGNTRITGNLLFGGNDNTKGTAGTKNMLLVSQGKDAAPEWKIVENFDIIKDAKWYLLGTISNIDTKGGIALNSKENQTGGVTYDLNYTVTQTPEETRVNAYKWGCTHEGARQFWQEFEGMDFTIPASNKAIRAFINLQLPIRAVWPQSTGVNTYFISCVVGVFKENTSSSNPKTLTLAASIQGGCIGTEVVNKPTTTLTMVSVIEIPASTTASKFRLLGAGRTFSTINLKDPMLYMGRDEVTTNSDREAFTRATLKVDIFASVK